jgi:hypothetical protein
MALALKGMQGKYLLPFQFKNQSRTTHYLFFVSKSFKDYEVMKDIMAGESSTSDGGVPSFAYSPADKDTPYLRSFPQPLNDLKGKLLCVFAERTMTMYQVYYENEHLALHQAVWRQRQRSSGSFRVCAAVRQSAVLLN